MWLHECNKEFSRAGYRSPMSEKGHTKAFREGVKLEYELFFLKEEIAWEAC